MPLATELMIDLMTVEPVMGGESKVAQREHILALLEEPFDSETQSGNRFAQLRARLQDPATPMAERAQIAAELKTLQQDKKGGK